MFVAPARARSAALAAALTALAAPSALAFPISSLSGTGQLGFEVISCRDKGGATATCADLAISPVLGQNAVSLFVRTGDVVPLGGDLLLEIVITGQAGFVFSSIFSTLDAAAPLASGGGNVFEPDFITGITNFAQAGPSTASIALGRAWPSVVLNVDYNGTRGLIGSITIGAEPSPVPVPAALGLFGMALAGLLVARRQRG